MSGKKTYSSWTGKTAKLTTGHPTEVPSDVTFQRLFSFFRLKRSRKVIHTNIMEPPCKAHSK